MNDVFLLRASCGKVDQKNDSEKNRVWEKKKEDQKNKTREAKKRSEQGSKRSVSTLSNDDDSDIAAFWQTVEPDESAGHAGDLLQPAGTFEPPPPPAAEYSSADVRPAAVGEPAARPPTAETRPMRRARSKQYSAEGKKQKVLQWLDAVQQHGCANTLCRKCGRCYCEDH